MLIWVIIAVDIVTEVDQAVEKMVSTKLSAAYPDISFMGEETYKPGMRVGPEPTFIVDPIDGRRSLQLPLQRHMRLRKAGTTNFIHQLPDFCISLGLAINRQPTIGVIYNPSQDLLFTAIKSKGAFMTRLRGSTPQRLPIARNPQPLTGLGTALLAIEWGSDRSGHNYDLKTDVFRKLAAKDGGMVHSLRSFGSAALNIAAVAAGWLDGYWEGGCWAWDVCAGWCVLEEAGGKMFSGNPGNDEPELESRVYLAVRGAPSGQKELVDELWGIIGDRKMDYSV
jgi:myo-inositol-1(or 4)-monophosphatase